MLLSILIPTLESRAALFARLDGRLREQIQRHGLEEQVEVLTFPDNGEATLGAKRNILIERASGDFVAFLDDDDDIHPDYVSLVCEAIQSNREIDCVGIRGVIYFRGKHPRPFIHSLKYRDYSSRGGVYTRPPYHLNPMKRSIAAAYQFREVSYSEDIEWALRICADGRLRREAFIDADLYFYYSRRHWFYQWMLDRTETFRHLLGLRLANRFALLSTLRKVFGSKRAVTTHS